jgi:hypothetical protein
MSETLNRLTRSVSTIVNQPGGRQFKDPEIKEFINLALGWATKELDSTPVKDIRFETDVTLPQGQTTLSVGVTNELPADFIVPIRMWESRDGKWMEMTMAPDHLPINKTPDQNLLWWEWRSGKLYFTGATRNVTVRIHYRGSISKMSVPLDTMIINGLEDVIVAKAAAMCSVVGKSDQAAYWDGTASRLLDRFIQTNIKPYQATGFRRKRRRISLPPWRY